ncbi:MAG: polysaccharide biosynthesis tyrosine autokinase [Verrucomicrobiae bacterium]|nr:polysaccharide biosynthesis tyrosine autokinase [Verrucomicrobiae bacterium]
MATENRVQLHFLDYWRVIKIRKWIILTVFLLTVLTGVLYTSSQPKLYSAFTRIKMERPDSIEINPFGAGKTDVNSLWLAEQIEIMQSEKVLSRVVEDLKLREKWNSTSDEAASSRLKAKLDVRPVRLTTILDISITDTDPKQCAELANGVAAIYVKSRFEQMIDTTFRAIGKLREEQDKQDQAVQEAQKRVDDLKREYSISSLLQPLEPGAAGILWQNLSAAHVDSLVREIRMKKVQSLTRDQLRNAITTIIPDAGLTKQQEALLGVELRMKLMLQDFGPQHPVMRTMKVTQDALREQFEAMLDGILKGIEIDFDVAKAREEALNSEVEKARQIEWEYTSGKYREFEKATRELESKTRLRDALKLRIAQEGIELVLPRVNVEVLDRAVPSWVPISPNAQRNVMMSIIAGLIIGVALAFFIEYLDTSIKTVEDVENYLGLPVLGIVPQHVKPLIQEGDDGHHAEIYRVVRTNLEFAKRDLGANAITVVSAGAGEGKSLTLFNLAHTYAKNGEKVLIVDSDLRRPSLHKILGMPHNVGLTNLLLEQKTLDEVIVPTSVPNLYFMPRGKHISSSSGVLNSQRMRDLIKELKLRYDMIFFDSPPIMAVSDAAILASEVDLTLMIIEYRKFPQRMSARAIQMVENVKGKVVGVVLNNINISADSSYYYYYTHYDYYSAKEGAPGKPVKEKAETPRLSARGKEPDKPDKEEIEFKES